MRSGNRWMAGVLSLLLMTGALVATASGQAILVPNSVTGDVRAFDPVDGTPLGGFELDAAVVSRPMNLADGFDGTLMVSDWNGVRLLDGTGAYLGNVTRTPLDELQCCGLTVIGTKIVVATTVDTKPFNRAGDLLPVTRGGNRDVMRVGDRILTTQYDDGNVCVFERDGTLVAIYEGIRKPVQMAALKGAGEFRLAVVGHGIINGEELPCVYLVRADGSITAFEIEGETATGIHQLESGNFLISSTAGILCYGLDGRLIATMVEGSGYSFFERCENYTR